MNRVQKFLNEKVIGSLLNFLIQGISPQKLALAISVGFLVGIFPILGTHTGLTILAIYVLRLNPASVLLITNLFFPLFFVFVIPFVRVGEFLFQAQQVSISIEGVKKMTESGFIYTLQSLGMTLVYAFAGWAIFSIPVGVAIYYITLKPLLSLNKHKKDKVVA